ncbi:MAG: DUF2203 domain-containing protein [Halobacteria archaeon]
MAGSGSGELHHDVHFSIEESRDLIDRLGPKVGRILELRHELDAKGFDIVSMDFVEPDPDDEKVENVNDTLSRIRELLDEIHETGALFKDPRFELGMLDFPHLTEEGEEVYLCWMYGEDELDYYHPIKEGMAGREKLEEL